MSEWQDIATAPLEGRFLVYGGVWEGEIHGPENASITLIDRRGYQLSVADTDGYSAWIDEATHWMPLPSPPVQTDRETK